jgi:hypothetical protein
MSRLYRLALLADVAYSTARSLVITNALRRLGTCLSIDIFPGCALLLKTFEGLTRTEAARLLDADTMMIRCGQIPAIADLTHHARR